MKKLLLLGSAICTMAVAANAQRICDVEITLLSPGNGATLNCQDNFNLTYQITNHGPDSILQGDTLRIQDPEAADTNTVWVYGISQTIPPDSTVLMWDSATNLSKTNFLFDAAGNYVLNSPFPDGTYKYGIIFTRFNDTLIVKDENPSNNVSMVDVTIDCTTSIFETNKLNTTPLAVYPNPASGDINFKYNFTANANNSSLRITDLAGRTVLIQEFGKQTIGERQFSIDITSLNAGMYYIELITDNTHAMNKITVAGK